MDSNDLARGRGNYERALASIEQPVLVGSLSSDALYVPAEQAELARLIPDAQLVTVDSLHGHDGFLIDAEAFHPQLLAFKNSVLAQIRSGLHFPAARRRRAAARRPPASTYRTTTLHGSAPPPCRTRPDRQHPAGRVTRLDTGPCQLFLKLESQNPGGSIKDRVGL